MDNLDLKAYCDAAFADELVSQYSTAGHIVFVAGGPIYWISKKQTLVTSLSTTEAEFINLTPWLLSYLDQESSTRTWLLESRTKTYFQGFCECSSNCYEPI